MSRLVTKPNKMACAPSEDSDQPGHPPSLIRVFAVRMKKAWVLSYPLSAHRRLWSDWADAQADLSFAGRIVILLVLSRGSSNWLVSETSGKYRYYRSVEWEYQNNWLTIEQLTKAFFMRTAKTLIRPGGCPGWSESSLGAHAILLVLSRGGSIHIVRTFGY